MAEIEDATGFLEGGKILKWTVMTTLVSVALSMFFMGGGHGTYFFGKLFFPISMIIAGMHEHITDLALWIAFFQFPIYGLVMYISRKSIWKQIGIAIIFLHVVLWIISMNVTSGYG